MILEIKIKLQKIIGKGIDIEVTSSEKEEFGQADPTELQSLYVCYDDLDIPFGKYKIQFGKHPKIHNGVDSVIKSLGTDQFWNVRIGTESRPQVAQRGQQGTQKSIQETQNADQTSEKIPGQKYVLSPFTKEERDLLAPVIQRVVQEIYAKAFPPQSSH